ncbi:MAG: ABC transporter permease [Candidatus Hodarchaeales archaeon]|jgi:ABC-2 type transport system permease protein
MRFAYLIAIRLWKQLLRDRRTLTLVLIGPVIYIIIFGMAFGGEIENVPIIVINKDSDAIISIPFIGSLEVPSIGEKVLEYLDDSSKVIVKTSNDYEAAKELVENKVYIAAIFIPENFTYNLVSPAGENISITLFVDNSNPQIGIAVLQALQESFQDAASGYKSNLGFNIEYAFGEGLRTIDYFAPAVIGLGVFFFSFILIMMNLIDERKKGTLALILQCPHDRGQIIIGYLGAFSILSMLQTTFIIVFAGVLYQVSFGTSILNYISLYIAAVILGWTSLVLGILLSSFARSEFQAVQFIPLVLFPAIFLSGVILPLIQIPEIFRWLSGLIPLTYGIHLLQRIAIEGYVLEPLNQDLLAMILFFLLFLFGSRLSLKET